MPRKSKTPKAKAKSKPKAKTKPKAKAKTKPKQQPKPKARAKPKPKAESCGGTCRKPKAKPRAKTKPKARANGTKPKPETRPKMIVHDNTSNRARRTTAAVPDPEPAADTGTSIAERVNDIGGTHVATGAGVGIIGQALAVVATGKGWIGPKVTAVTLLGTGGATTAAGLYFEKGHLTAAGVGLTAAGALSLTNQLAVDAYESIERRADEKRKKAEEERVAGEHAKKLDEARALLEAEKKHRNARRIEIIEPDDGDLYDDPDGYATAA
jgi:hypothetical protein